MVDERANNEYNAKYTINVKHEDQIATCVIDVVDAYIDVQSSKQATSKVSKVHCESLKPRRTIRKRSEGIIKSKTECGPKIRVGCPFRKRYPTECQPMLACRGVGFSESGKLKDHLKLHDLPEDFISSKLNFKGDPRYRNVSLKEKWILAFRELFPEVPEKDIPSPYVHDSTLANKPAAGSGVQNSERFKSTLFQMLKEDLRVDIYCGMPDFDAQFSRIFDNAFKKTASGTAGDRGKGTVNVAPQSLETSHCWNQIADTPELSYDCDTAPTSVENSPVMDVDHGLRFYGLPPSTVPNAYSYGDQRFGNAGHQLNTCMTNDHAFLSNYGQPWMHATSNNSFNLDLPCYATHGATGLDLKPICEQPRQHNESAGHRSHMGVDAFMDSTTASWYPKAFPPLFEKVYALPPSTEYLNDYDYHDLMNWDPPQLA